LETGSNNITKITLIMDNPRPETVTQNPDSENKSIIHGFSGSH
jgi:hypothetical protein